LDPSANIYIAGHFIEWADLDPDAGSLNVTSSGAEDIFVERVGSSLAPLPVRFSDIKAYKQNYGIRIEWSNLSESNLSHYTIERSANAQSFEVIAKISPSKNNRDRADYFFYDAAPPGGVNFYRIQSVEANEQRSYSSILKVLLSGGQPELLIYPNPAINQLVSLSAMDIPQGRYFLRIVNSWGQQLQEIQLSINQTALSKTIQLSPALKGGVYHLQLVGSGLRIEKSFVIR
jgi:hypothetical protein